MGEFLACNIKKVHSDHLITIVIKGDKYEFYGKLTLTERDTPHIGDQFEKLIQEADGYPADGDPSFIRELAKSAEQEEEAQIAYV